MEDNIFFFIIFGLIAQIIDGTLGMGYGVTSNSLLLFLGLPPATASASVHTAEIATTGISGFSHFKFANVDKQLFWRLVIPGVIGGIIGAYLLSNLDGGVLKPWISGYLAIMGVYIIYRSFSPRLNLSQFKHTKPLGFVAGFCDAIGGGGWGPIATTTLVANGQAPRTTIGTVNLAEFFVTISQSVTFFLAIGLSHWRIITGLLIGGAIAAPFGAYLCKKLPHKSLMVAVGVMIIALSAYNLRKLWLPLLG